MTKCRWARSWCFGETMPTPRPLRQAHLGLAVFGGPAEDDPLGKQQMVDQKSDLRTFDACYLLIVVVGRCLDCGRLDGAHKMAHIGALQ